MPRRLPALLLVVLVAGGLSALWTASSRSGFPFPDGFYYAEMGRQLQWGEGFSSLQGFPYLFQWLRERDLSLAPPWPNVTRFPLVTVVYAAAFAIGGASDVVAKAVGAGFFVATAVAVFLLGVRSFGVGTGLLAALLFASSPGQLAFSASGLLETGAGCFLVCSALLLAIALEGGARGAALALGVVLGLAFLWRFDLLVLVPAAVLVLCLRRERHRWAAVWRIALGFALAVGPWVVRNLVLYGSPLAMLAIDRNLFAGHGRPDPYGGMQGVDVPALLFDPGFLAEKLATLSWPLAHWRLLFGPWLSWLGPAFLAAGAVFALRRHAALGTWIFAAAALVLRAVVLSLTHHELRFYASFAPLLLLLAIGGLAVILDALPWRLSRLRITTGTAVVLLSVGVVAVRGYAARDATVTTWRAPKVLRMMRQIGELTMPGSIVLARQPELVAWYADRFAVAAPPTSVAWLERRAGIRADAVLHPRSQLESVREAMRTHGLLGEFTLHHLANDSVLWVREGARVAAAPAGDRSALASWPGTHPPPWPAPHPPPRLVLLYAPCTVNASYLSPYRPDVFYTPALSSFAAESAVFERHQSESDQSGIAYAALLSGRQAPGHGVFSHPVAIERDVELVTEAFAEEGWDVFFWANQGMASPGLGYAQGVPPANVVRGRPLAGEDEPFREILERVAADPAYRALVVANFTVTHYPYADRVEELRGRFPAELERLADGISAEDRAWAMRLYRFRLDLQKDFPRTRDELGLSPLDVRRLAGAIDLFYASGVAHLDVLFGSAVRAVDERGLRDESLIVFTADHGEVLYRDNALFPWSHDFQLAPESLRVPLLIRGPGVVPRRVAGVTRSIDVFPTVASLAGVRVDDPGVTGVDLAPFLATGEPVPPLVAFSHTPRVRSDVVRKAQQRWKLFSSYYPSTDVEHLWVSLRSGDVVAKWRRKADGRFGFEVFDLAADPEERRNLFRADDPRHVAMARALVRYKAELLTAHDLAEARKATPEIDARELESLRRLGYVQ